MQEYHLVWLEAHPHRAKEWLEERLREGFDVHHLDGNHSNNEPGNLVLIEHTDHMMLHGGRTLGRLKPRNKTWEQSRRRKGKAERLKSKAYQEYKQKYQESWA